MLRAATYLEGFFNGSLMTFVDVMIIINYLIEKYKAGQPVDDEYYWHK